MSKRKFYLKKASIETLDALTRVLNECQEEADEGIKFLAEQAQGKAKRKLGYADIRQKYAALLPEQIGVSYKDGIATIFAPIDNTQTMREQMHFAEYGTGWHEKTWGYYTFPQYDKIPSSSIKIDKKGRAIATVKISYPAGYMKSARRYLMQNARGEEVERIRLALTRKPIKHGKYSLDGDDEEEFEE